MRSTTSRRWSQRSHRYRALAAVLAIGTGVVALTGCGADEVNNAAESSGVLPAEIGGWAEITAEQAFDSRHAPADAGVTTDSFISEIQSTYEDQWVDLIGSEVRFKGGATPEVGDIRFYAPDDQRELDAPINVALVLTYELPEVVDGDGILIDGFRMTVAELLAMPVSEMPIYVGNETLLAITASRDLLVAQDLQVVSDGPVPASSIGPDIEEYVSARLLTADE